jgi:OmpA family/PEGA domain
MRTSSCALGVLFLTAASLCAASTFAQSAIENGKLKIHVEPKQAYVFVDGLAIRDGSQTITLAAGDHRVAVYNYGYVPKAQEVHIGAGESTDLRVTLQSEGDMVAGPFGDIEFKGHPRAAVLLNGKTPDYFVGHVDEFDWNWIWHQRLLVKPSTYQVSITREGKTIWSGPVTVKAGEQVTVYLDRNGEMKTKQWKEGLTMGPQPRFHAGIASATVPVAPVGGQLAAQTTQLACGQPTNLKWHSTDAVDTSISGIGEVPSKGDRAVNPTHDTTYVLTAKGPGGEFTKRVTVKVNGEPTATLTVSQPEIHYHKIGDRVVQDDSATLRWSTWNAKSAKVEPFDNTALTGSQTITADPKQTSTGPVNENVTYRLTATNACGGTVTKTATLHVVGSIDPPPAITLASLFYPTAYPTKHHPKVGLLVTEQATLSNAATQFKTYGLYDGKASLVIVGHADVRGSEKYNQALSDRRAELVKDYFVAHGVPADQITTRAEGKDQQIDLKTVQAQETKNGQQPAKWMTQNQKATWLAYNRRADVVLEPKGQQSAKVYPAQSANARILWQRPEPSLKQVELASKASSSGTQQASLSQTGK